MRYLTAGESHGSMLAGILEGFPAGVDVASGYIEKHLERRRRAPGRSSRQKLEKDKVEIISGLNGGVTTGAPVALLIPNMACLPPGGPREADHVPRPGHADLAGMYKYGISDANIIRERASARETAMRTALACFPRRLLEKLDIILTSRVIRIGAIEDDSNFSGPLAGLAALADSSPVRCLDPETGRRMITEIEEAAVKGETLGGIFEVYAEGVPVGLGSHAQWDRRLGGSIAAQFMSLNAVKGVEIGDGFHLSGLSGSLAQDGIVLSKRGKRLARAGNRMGGIEGGMSCGGVISVRAAMKPLPGSIPAASSVDLVTGSRTAPRESRSDTCAVPAAAVIGEFLLAAAVAEALLEKFGSDSFHEIEERVRAWRKSCRIPLKKTGK